MRQVLTVELRSSRVPAVPRRLLRTLLLAIVLWTSTAAAQTETISLNLKLQTGGSLDGLVVDHTSHGIVVVHDKTPYVFAWDEIEAGSAVAAKRSLLTFERGGRELLTADDHFELGRFALLRSRNSLAAMEFRKARKLDPQYEDLIRKTLDDYRKNKASAPPMDNPLEIDFVAEALGSTPPGLTERVDEELSEGDGLKAAVHTSEEIRAKVLTIYKSFGETVREVLGNDIVLIESEHFLIWTDWEKRSRPRLARWCEAMYAALCRQFDLDPADLVFLSKCPVFCFRSKARFRRFARQFDGFEGGSAIGYTRSIERNGHVHLVLVRQGRSERDYSRFACTLVHEGTHAFLHRLYTTQLIPHWINEGYADLVAERVMGDRCPNAENAALLAKPYVRYDWPIRELLHGVGPIAVHQYAIAHSVVAHLESYGAKRFAGFVKSLKEGLTVAAALAVHYDGMTLDELEARWRSAIRAINALGAH